MKNNQFNEESTGLLFFYFCILLKGKQDKGSKHTQLKEYKLYSSYILRQNKFLKYS